MTSPWSLLGLLTTAFIAGAVPAGLFAIRTALGDRSPATATALRRNLLVPAVFFLPLAGALADHWGPRDVALFGVFVAIVGIGLIAIVPQTQNALMNMVGVSFGLSLLDGRHDHADADRPRASRSGRRGDESRLRRPRASAGSSGRSSRRPPSAGAERRERCCSRRRRCSLSSVACGRADRRRRRSRRRTRRRPTGPEYRDRPAILDARPRAVAVPSDRQLDRDVEPAVPPRASRGAGAGRRLSPALFWLAFLAARVLSLLGDAEPAGTVGAGRLRGRPASSCSATWPA